MTFNSFAVMARSCAPLSHLFKRLMTAGFMLFSLTVLLLASNLLPPISMAFASPPAPGVPLSSCSLDGQRNVTVSKTSCGGSVVYVDKSYTGASGFGVISIASGATLTFENVSSSRTIDTAGIVVSGVLQAGSASNRITDKNAVTINFTAASGVTKGIIVNAGGSLKLFGASGVAAKGSGSHAPSWTYLRAPAGPSAAYGPGLGVASPVSGPGAATTLQLADKVDWKAGQWIVVAGTDFSPDSGEFVRISNVSHCKNSEQGVCTITLDSGTPLVTYHYGGPAPPAGGAASSAGVAQNYGVDERAEVGLVSRNIKLTATVPAGSADGGEIKILSGFKEVKIQGVEIEKFGKAQLGSYPIHFHHAGTAAPGSVLVDSNSIHHSYNKCVTLHATNGVTISNNVCARAVGNLYYLETGTETNDAFIGNLGIGAMSNEFAIPSASAAAQAAFWPGDYLVRGVGGAGGNGYSGFKVKFTDDGAAVSSVSRAPSGFWITNLGGNTYTGNSIAGCQAVGRGFWILPPAYASAVTAPPAGFTNNRAHGCYNGFDTASDDGVTGAADYTPQGKCLASASGVPGNNCDVVAEFDGLTATRNRNRGIWVRASWYAIKNARLATNRDGVSLVSSGGTEGSPPGEWSLLRDAIIVGISANNPLRFGPCPYAGQNGFGGNAGCYEAVQDNGYPPPSWNLAGMMFYDGPARLEHVRFVNFNKDITPYLTAADAAFLNYYSTNGNTPGKVAGNTIPGQPKSPFIYEGDAAMGWFQSNVNSYPPTQYVRGLSYYNVDLRHQVYTQDVGLTAAASGVSGSNFRDGDKFTVILDRDGSLTGLHVSGVAASGVYPISLNNLPFLSGPGTVDECHSTGKQDEVLEGRPTSLISPYSYATLEFTALTPPCATAASGPQCTNGNILIFTKDQRDYYHSQNIQFTDSAIINSAITNTPSLYTVNCGGTAIAGASGVPGHACVALTGRNGNGIYEPKVVNGLGYTVGAASGVPGFVSLTYTDARLPGGISRSNPFHTRIGICYKNQGAQAPAATAFTVKKGSKSLAGPNGNPATLAPTYFKALTCNGLDNFNPSCSGTSCNGICPSAPYYTQAASGVLPSVSKITDLDDPAKCPNGECYFYDRNSGLLFLNMVQERPNAGGPYSSPLGSCAGKMDANGICADESFYSCPGAGCELYTIQVDGSYAPGSAPSACTPYGAGSGPDDYTQPYPADMNTLATANGVVKTAFASGVSGNFPHRVLTNAPVGMCPTHAPKKADWPSATNSEAVFTLSPGSGATATVSSGTTKIPKVPGTALVLLTAGQTYTLAASGPSGSCSQRFTVAASGVGFTSDGNNQCQMGTSSSSNILTPSAGPYSQWFTLSPPANVTATVLGVPAVSGVPATNTQVLLAPSGAYTLTATATGGGLSTWCMQSFAVNADANGYTSNGDSLCQMASHGGTTLVPGQGPYTPRFNMGVPANIRVQITKNGTNVPITGNSVILNPGQYTLTAASAPNCATTSGAPNCACQQNFTVSASGTGSSSGTCCGMAFPSRPSNQNPTIAVGNAPYTCKGP